MYAVFSKYAAEAQMFLPPSAIAAIGSSDEPAYWITIVVTPRG